MTINVFNVDEKPTLTKAEDIEEIQDIGRIEHAENETALDADIS